MQKNTQDILSRVADAVNEKAVSFQISIIAQNRLQKWFQQLGWMPMKKEFLIRPIVLGNLIRISKLLLTINPQAITGKNFLDIGHKMIADHADTMAIIIAIAIQNNRHEPSAKLVAIIKNNLSSRELYELLAYVLDKMDLKNFISSIISIRGLNVLDDAEQNEVSPKSQGS